jgi:protein tyrosine/serine phosphatase
MPRLLQGLLALVIVVILVGTPVGYAAYRKAHVRNFRVVRDGVLYRSGQLSEVGLKRVLYDYQIKTVISLRDAAAPGQEPPDRAEEEHCRKRAINYVRIPPRNWSAPDGSVPAEVGVRQFLEVLDNPANHPVLIHCLRGVHRTGAYCAVFRMEYDGWSHAAALAELRELGYDRLTEEWDVREYLERYQLRR